MDQVFPARKTPSSQVLEDLLHHAPADHFTLGWVLSTLTWPLSWSQSKKTTRWLLKPVQNAAFPAPIGEPVEPLLTIENAGEFPTLTDQGEESVYPPKKRADGSPSELDSGQLRSRSAVCPCFPGCGERAFIRAISLDYRATDAAVARRRGKC